MTKLARDESNFPIPVLGLGPSQTVAVDAAAAETAVAFTSKVVRVVADVDCNIKLGTGAATTDAFLPAGVVEYYKVRAGDTLSFIQALSAPSAGTAFITDMA